MPELEKCVFCEIATGEKNEKIILDRDGLVAFNDIKPSASAHILIVPKQHIVSVKDMQDDDAEVVGKMIIMARDIARAKNFTGYKLAFNVGRDGGQVIDHLHLHLLDKSGIKLP